MAAPQTEHVNNTFIASMVVANPGIFGRDLRRISEYSHVQFVVSRIWHDGHVSVPSPDTIVEKDDRLLVVASRRDIDTLEALIGRREQTDWNRSDVDWNSIDSSVVSRSIVVTRPSINGRSLGSLHLRNSYGINISRIVRSGVILLATPDLVLQLGDRVVVVGEAPAVDKAAAMLGNAVRELNEPHLPAIFVGLLAGLIVGAIPLAMPGMSAPLKLGLAGGPIIVGILIGAFGYRLHIITYSTESVNLMLRALGLSLYLSCLGLSAGPTFFEAAWCHVGGARLRRHAAAYAARRLVCHAPPQGRLRHDVRHAVRCHGQPHGADLCQRDLGRRPSLCGLYDGLSAVDVHQSGARAGNIDDFYVKILENKK